MTDVLSDEERTVFEIVNFASICCIVGMFGILANIANLIVFSTQGFKNTVNIGFFGLAISDMICLITLLWASVCMNPLFTASGMPWFPLEVMYLSAAWPHVSFSIITSWVTAYVTAERYFSIALPLKVKSIITPKTATFSVCLIYLVNLVTLIPEYTTSYLGWRFDASKNQTRIGILFTSSRSSVEGAVYVLHSVLGIASFTGVILFTTLLVIKLRQSARWRQEATSSSNKTGAMSGRDQKTVKMVLVIACVLIACYTPGAVISLAAFIVGPEFNVRGSYVNIAEAMWSVAGSFQAINSSINVFFYYSMSSKYKQTFHEVILKCKSYLPGSKS